MTIAALLAAIVAMACLALVLFTHIRREAQIAVQLQTAEQVRQDLQERNDQLTMSLVNAYGGHLKLPQQAKPLRPSPGWFDKAPYTPEPEKPAETEPA